MAEIQPSDIGLATFADVGDVNNLNTATKVVVEAINEIYANSSNGSLGEQVYNNGEDNIAVGGGNVIFGNGNRILGSNNVIFGDNHIVIGSNKTIANSPELTFDWYDITSKRMYFNYYGDESLRLIPVGTKVVISISISWSNEDWNDYITIDSEKVITEITEFNLYNRYITVKDVPLLPEDSPDEIHTVFDSSYVSTFLVLSNEYKTAGNSSINMGGDSSGENSFTANNGNALGDYSAAMNLSTSKDYCGFSTNLSCAEGTYSFTANRGRTYQENCTALNNAYAYVAYSVALNSGRTSGRAIKCTALDCSSNSVTAAVGEVLSGLVGTKVLLRYKSPYSAIIYDTKTVANVNGQTIAFKESFNGANYSLMLDGYVFRVESSYGNNFATGTGCAGNTYSQAHGMNTLCVNRGAVIYGKYGITPEDYSWSLANGTAFTSMSLAIKMLQNGDIAADGTLSSPCADYAEYFEWKDGNPHNEDRTGYFVKLDGDKIIKCDEFDTPIGIVSAMPAIIGDSGEMHWQGKFVTDDFGRIQYHDVVIPAELDADGNIIVEEHTETQPIINPNWDSSAEYIPRKNRSEWSTVGVLGKLIVFDDGALCVGDKCRCGNGGKAVKSIENGYHVLKRVSDDKVLIWVR